MSSTDQTTPNPLPRFAKVEQKVKPHPNTKDLQRRERLRKEANARPAYMTRKGAET